MKIITRSAKQTQKLGENLAKEILKKKNSKKAVVLTLEGNLGSGKTTLLQGFAKGLEIKDKITSPTFAIYKKFQIPKHHSCNNRRPSIITGKHFYHIDCYRINSPKEILELGFEEIISEPKNIVAVEWSEKIEKILPKNILKIKFKFIDEKTRKLTIKK